MKSTIVRICLLLVLNFSVAWGADVTDARTQNPQKESTMIGVSIGNNMKMNAPASERGRIEDFYGNVLGCEITKKKGMDFIRFSNDFYIGMIFDDNGPSATNYMKATWLEIRTANPEELQKKILAFGINGINHWDKEHFYFQAPGGQVYRLAPNDMVNGWGLNR